MDFRKLGDYLDSLRETMRVPAYDCTVRIGRETVFRRHSGCREDGLYWYYSATKLYTATAACRLLEQGRLQLEDPVSRYLPEYAHLRVKAADGVLHPAHGEPTIRHLFTMCGGLSYDIFSPEIQNATDRSTRGIVRAIADMPLLAEPGTEFNYSLCHDVLAAVVEVVSGKLYADYIVEEIAEPLGAQTLSFHPDAAQLARLEPQYRWKGRHREAVDCGPDNVFAFSEDYDSGGAGLCAASQDYLLLPEALANGGCGRDGYSVLKPETIERMRQNQLSDALRQTYLRRFGHHTGYSYALGVRTRVNHDDGGLSPLGEFGWDGAAGAYCFMDPSRRLSVLYVQHVLDMGPVYDTVHPMLRDLIYEGLQDS